jgi:hypothetical protein
MEHFLRGGAVQAIAIQLVRTVGVVQFAEEQGQAVVGPGHAAVAVVEGQFADLVGGQFLDVQGVDLVATGVEAVGQALVVGADAERAEGKEAAVGQGLGSSSSSSLLSSTWLLSSAGRGSGSGGRTRRRRWCACSTGRGPRGGQRQVGFEDAALDLFEQGFAQAAWSASWASCQAFSALR